VGINLITPMGGTLVGYTPLYTPMGGTLVGIHMVYTHGRHPGGYSLFYTHGRHPGGYTRITPIGDTLVGIYLAICLPWYPGGYTSLGICLPSTLCRCTRLPSCPWCTRDGVPSSEQCVLFHTFSLGVEERRLCAEERGPSSPRE